MNKTFLALFSLLAGLMFSPQTIWAQNGVSIEEICAVQVLRKKMLAESPNRVNIRLLNAVEDNFIISVHYNCNAKELESVLIDLSGEDERTIPLKIQKIEATKTLLTKKQVGFNEDIYDTRKADGSLVNNKLPALKLEVVLGVPQDANLDFTVIGAGFVVELDKANTKVLYAFDRMYNYGRIESWVGIGNTEAEDVEGDEEDALPEVDPSTEAFDSGSSLVTTDFLKTTKKPFISETFSELFTEQQIMDYMYSPIDVLRAAGVPVN